MATYKLHRWSVVFDTDPYKAPEARCSYLQGYRDQETQQIITSGIAKVNGREITTNSGSIYILEDICSDYLDWLDQNGYAIDPTNPIKPAKKV